MNLRVTTKSTWPDLLKFLSTLENYKRILSISRCRVQVTGKERPPMLQATFELGRYVWVPQPSAPKTTEGEAANP